MLANLQKIIAFVGAPAAVLYSLGLSAFVSDLWILERTYGFRFLAAWYAAGLVDKEVIFGIGIWLLPLSFIAGFIVLWILSFFIVSLRTITFGRPNPPAATPPAPGADPDFIPPPTAQPQKPPTEKWLWLAVAALVVGIPLSLGFAALWKSSFDGLLNDMPCVKMVRTIGAEESSGSAEGGGQVFAGQVEPSGTGANGEHVFSGSIKPSDGDSVNGQGAENQENETEDGGTSEVTGILLSGDSSYWYVIENAGQDKGNISIIPIAEASEMEVLSRPEARTTCP